MLFEIKFFWFGLSRIKFFGVERDENKNSFTLMLTSLGLIQKFNKFISVNTA